MIEHQKKVPDPFFPRIDGRLEKGYEEGTAQAHGARRHAPFP
jgi:hypothetical protein